MRISITVLTLTLALAGCGSADPNASANLESYRPHWEKVADGSFLGGSTSDQARMTMRCWPDAQNHYVCLQAGELDLSGGTMIARTEENELPTLLLPVVSADEGYGCTYALGPHETISRRGQQLVSNVVDRNGRWSRGFVGKYLTDNGVGGAAWFPCLEVLDAVRGGSLATLGTTSIKRSMAGGV